MFFSCLVNPILDIPKAKSNTFFFHTKITTLWFRTDSLVSLMHPPSDLVRYSRWPARLELGVCPRLGTPVSTQQCHVNWENCAMRGKPFPQPFGSCMVCSFLGWWNYQNLRLHHETMALQCVSLQIWCVPYAALFWIWQTSDWFYLFQECFTIESSHSIWHVEGASHHQTGPVCGTCTCGWHQQK